MVSGDKLTSNLIPQGSYFNIFVYHSVLAVTGHRFNAAQLSAELLIYVCVDGSDSVCVQYVQPLKGASL